jgi:hypothetical protein
MKILEDKHRLSVENIYHILNNISLIKWKIYLIICYNRTSKF